jgi:hypothetical protein
MKGIKESKNEGEGRKFERNDLPLHFNGQFRPKVCFMYVNILDEMYATE